MAAAFADPEIRGIITGLWMLGVEYYAARTDGVLTLTRADVGWLAGREQARYALRRLRAACDAVGYAMREENGAVLITIRNFAKRQGLDYAAGGVGARSMAEDSVESAPPPKSEDRSPKTEDRERRSTRPRSEPARPSPPRLLNLLSKEDGPDESKIAFALEMEPIITAEAEADHPRDAKARSAKVRSLTLRYWRAQLRREAKGGSSGNMQADLEEHERRLQAQR